MLSEDLRRAAEAAVRYAEAGEELNGIIPTEPAAGGRVYVCAYTRGDARSWLAFDDGGTPVSDRRIVRDAVSIAALCELAEETAAGGDLDGLAQRIDALKRTEAPVGIEEAEAAVGALRAVVERESAATPQRLDDLGSATRRLELALGGGASPFSEAMKASMASVEALTAEVERNYKLTLR